MTTAGPWEVRYAKDFKGMVWEGEGHPYTIASERGTVICKGCLNGPETDANAQAIAALPELVEALLAIREDLRHGIVSGGLLPLIDRTLQKAGVTE